MATTETRRESFQQVMLCMETQTQKPDRIFVCLDRVLDLDSPAMRCRPRGIASSFYLPRDVGAAPGLGVFTRWAPLRTGVVGEIRDEDLVSVIDDDWFFDPWYLEASRSHWLGLNTVGQSVVVGWMGWISNVHMVAASVRYPCPIPLAYATGGLLTGSAVQFRAGWHRAPDPIAGTDDLTLNLGLQRTGIRRVRPAGWSHAVELPAHRAPDALQMKNRDKILGGLREFFAKHGGNAL